jgi:phage recombination protein Bet
MTITGNAVARRDGHELTPQASTALAIRPGQEMWNDKQKAALAVLGIKDATNADLAVFMHYCQKTGLDPFSRQIYMIMRRVKDGDQWVAKQTIQVGIDGFRVIRDRVAARTGSTVEYEDTIWYDSLGQETGVWLHDEPPAACKVTVIRDGRRFPGVVRTAAYAATNKQGDMISQWRTQPDHMIEKCAEAFALRRAFPHDLGGIYVEEEIPAGEHDAPPPAQARLTAADITTRRQPAEEPRQRPTGSRGAPTAQGNDSAASTASRAEPEDPTTAASADATDSTGGPAPQQAARPTGAQLGKLGKLLKQVPLGTPDDDAAFLHWQAGRPVTLTDISRDECAAAAGYLEKALEGAQGNADEAASMIWAAYKAAHEQASDG